MLKEVLQVNNNSMDWSVYQYFTLTEKPSILATWKNSFRENLRTSNLTQSEIEELITLVEQDVVQAILASE